VLVSRQKIHVQFPAPLDQPAFRLSARELFFHLAHDALGGFVLRVPQSLCHVFHVSSPSRSMARSLFFSACNASGESAERGFSSSESIFAAATSGGTVFF